jgi:hypothetical protein
MSRMKPRGQLASIEGGAQRSLRSPFPFGDAVLFIHS